MSVIKEIALCYKIPRLTILIEEDIKLLKKLNTILIKLEKTYKEQTILEALNTLRALDNLFDIVLLYSVIFNFVDIRFHETLIYMLEKLNNISRDDIQKLKDISEE